MPPVSHPIPRFAAEPPQEPLPYGRFAERLRAEFLQACLRIDTEGEELGEPGDIAWFPERSWHGRTYVPASARTSAGLEVLGFVGYLPDTEGGEPSEFFARADFTADLAERNPDWTMDLGDDVIGRWRGESGEVAAMTLVWGRALVRDGVIATAELAGEVVDQCPLDEERFTLIAPDDYRGDFLEIRLWDRGGRELARESLYAEDEEDEEDGGEDAD
ncbi:MAG: hypothetical protein E6G56_04480 [Actinobacteria bacterium]|nr:MAG: hypothetical protein E6G56_04480 [Actinomycetota bacterium]